MNTLLETSLTHLPELEIHAEQAEVVTWQGREALRLENGLALHSLIDYRIRLEDVGFKQVKQLGERWLSAIK